MQRQTRPPIGFHFLQNRRFDSHFLYYFLSMESCQITLFFVLPRGLTSRLRVQRYGNFLNWQNIIQTFFEKLSSGHGGGLRRPLYLFIFTYTLMRGRGEYQIRLPFVLSRADGNEVAAGLIGILEVNSHNLLTPAYIRILRILFICAYICIFSN